MAKIQSPCIGVCKFKREGHCLGCSMTKDQKSAFKSLKRSKHQEAFVAMLMAQQRQMGRYTHWLPEYLRKCLKKGKKPADTVRKAA
ncbi:MAG: DUF1289 domain-containing protein [Pseudomonadota bacterium]